MIGDKFDFNGRSYEIKKDVTFGEYRKISNISNKLISLSEKYGVDADITEIDPKIQAKIVNEFTITTDKQLDIMVDFLANILGLKQKDIDELSLTDAVGLFNKTFAESTTVKKKSEKTSDSPYS